MVDVIETKRHYFRCNKCMRDEYVASYEIASGKVICVKCGTTYTIDNIIKR